jgi:hypothetical protein
MRLRPAVAGDAEQLERHLPPAVLIVGEGQRKIAVNAALDLTSLGAHANGLRHRQGAVCRDVDG